MKLSFVLLGLCAAVTVAGCGSGVTSPRTTQAAAGATGPVSVVNCGRTITLPSTPKRIVSLWPSITEMLIALGAGDHIVGQAFTDQSPPLPKYAAAFRAVKTLGTNAISREVLLAARPDLVVADGEYHFNGKELPTIAALKSLGIPVYIVSSFCHGQVTTGRVPDVRTDLTALGTLAGSSKRAATLSADVTDELRAVARTVSDAPRTPIVLCQVYDKAVYALAGGLYSDVVNRAGGRNLYDGSLPPKQYYAQVSLEDIARRNPSTIVVAVNGPADAKAARTYLTRELPTVAAVRSGRLVVVPSLDFINLRAVDGVRLLAGILHPRA